MKKAILLFVVLFAVSSVTAVFAEITRVQSGNGVEVEWKFKPEVSTYVGYNIDWGHFGMEGKAKLTLKNEIRAKSSEEFTRDDESLTVYSKIEVKDLEIKFEVAGPQGQGRGDDTLVPKTVKVMDTSGEEVEVLTKDTKLQEGKQGVRVKWGDINGTIYIGPAYIQLKSKEHEKVDYVQSLSSMDFVTVKQDVVTPYSTAKYQATDLFADVEGLKTSDDGSASAVKKTLDYTDSDINNSGYNKQLASIKVGFKMDKIVDASVGFSMKYSFKESLMTKDDKKTDMKKPFNPFAFSLATDLLAVDNLTLKFKFASIFSKLNKDKKLEFLGEGNPVSLGMLTGYKITIGDSFFVKPSVAMDIAFEKKAPYNKPKVKPAKKSEAEVLTIPYEVGLGVVFGFQDSVKYLVDSKTTDVMDLFDGDEKVFDGFGVGFLYGSTPYDKVRSITIPYIGVKATVWDSEDGDVIGLIPGLKHGLIFNFNYALGATQTVDDVKYDIKPTADVGLGYEASYTISFLKVKFGTLFKAFNITDVKEDFTTEGSEKKAYKRDVKNPLDLRFRVGVDIVKLVPNTTFQIGWESGDLLRTNDSKPVAAEYHGAKNFFRAGETGTGADGDESKAQYGYVFAGAKIAF